MTGMGSWQVRGRILCLCVIGGLGAGLNGSAHSEEAHATATFAMYCYWTGEATLGRVEGVVASRIGHWGGEEIVQVDFDPSRTSIADLVAALEKKRSIYHVVVDDGEDLELVRHELGSGSKVAVFVRRGKARFIEPKHSLRTAHPELWALDLTESQRIALNSWSYFGGPMPDVLSAEQKLRVNH